MSSSLAPYLAQIPIGQVVGTDVLPSTDLVRWLDAVFRRVGSTTSLTNLELAAFMADIEASATAPASDLVAQEAMRAVEELRSEMASLRSDCDSLRNLLAERESELAGLRSAADLRQRVEQLEGIVL